jgi:outer membrane receptor for ferric coprogen and ferric-rhodotorulic acid
MTTLEDAARRTTGMVVLQNDRGRSSIFSRGFEFDTFNIDGLPAPLSSIYGTQPDLAPFDRVEILRGAAGLFAGTGEPAGVLNMARKRANRTFGASATGTAGSWDNYRGEADVNVPLTANGNVRARFVGAWQDADNFVSYNSNNVKVAYGTLEIDITPQTTLSLVALHQERDIVPFNGLPAYANGQLASVDRSTFSGAVWNRFNNLTDDYIAELEHKFDNGGRAKASLRYSDREADFKYSYGAGAGIQPNGNYARTTLDRDYWEKTLSWDAHVSTPFQAFGQTHNLLFGVDHRRYDQRVFATGPNGLPSIANNIFAPNPFVPEPNVPFATFQDDTPRQTGTYGQLRVKPIAPLTLIAGGRVSWYEIDSTNLVTNFTTHSETNGKFTPYLGVVLDLTTNISAYGVFTEIFQPQPGATGFGGTILPPREGSQYEAGLKGAFMDGALNASVGYFVTRDTNRAIGDPSNPTFQIAAGKAEVQGLEAEISGKLAPGWQMFTGYAYTVSQYLESYRTYNPGNGAVTGIYLAGQTFSTWTPKHNFNLWTKYEFQSQQLTGWHIAGGVRFLSSFFTRNGFDTVRWTENGYTVADAQIGYKLNKNIEATFTVNNILDEVYYTRLGNQTTFNFYGEPRSYWLKVTAKM